MVILNLPVTKSSLFSLFNHLNKLANISKSNKKKELLYNKRSTDMQGSCWGQIDVDSQLVAELLQLIHHFGFGWRVAPEQSQLREFLVDVVCRGNVSQQHELLHQPGEQCEVVKQCRLTKNKKANPFWETNRWNNGSSGYSLVTISVLVNIAALRHHGLFVQSERQFQLKINKTKPYSENACSCFCTIYCLIIENYWELYRDKRAGPHLV